jgi:D-3-phosphoglycerate dehydrogenase
MRYRILISDPLHADALAWLAEQQDVQVDVQPDVTPDELRRQLGLYDALIVRSRTVVGSAELAKSDRLMVIGRAGTGLDNIAVTEAEARGITVLNAPGANAGAVAELTLGLLLSLARDLPQTIAAQQRSLGMELAGKELGIIGFGQIGLRVARLAQAFEMRIVAHDLVDRGAIARELDVTLLKLDELLGRSDFISLHLPLTDETYHLINEQTLSLMAKKPSLVNTARAEIVDESAIVRALDDGRLYRYAADLYQAKSPLIGHPKALLTPHIGASTTEAQRRAGLEIAKCVVAALRSTPSERKENKNSRAGV